ncbi:SxtJ family membrane protein [Prochlorococcus marinus]|uniref:SxtJ family membrane protein n=1 Tax=Prochlorococcus marinus TaxID=1219 RepID=UPI0022B4DBA7|nr:SxtJ family membrane protein [Prochlorococcus marinus]
MNQKPSKKQLRDFGYLIAIAFPLILGWLIPLITGHHFRIWTLWVSLPSLFLAIISPASLSKPYKAWIFIGDLLGWINSRIILGLVFIIVLQPISFLMRLFGYDPLRLKSLKLDTYRESVKNGTIDLTRIF